MAPFISGILLPQTENIEGTPLFYDRIREFLCFSGQMRSLINSHSTTRMHQTETETSKIKTQERITRFESRKRSEDYCSRSKLKNARNVEWRIR